MDQNPFNAWEDPTPEYPAPYTAPSAPQQPVEDNRVSTAQSSAPPYANSEHSSGAGPVSEEETESIQAPKFLGIFLCLFALLVFLLNAVSVELKGWDAKVLEWPSYFFTNEFLFYTLLIFTGCSIISNSCYQKPFLIAVLAVMVSIRPPQLICHILLRAKSLQMADAKLLSAVEKSYICAIVADASEMILIFLSVGLIIFVLKTRSNSHLFTTQKKEILISVFLSLASFFNTLPAATFLGRFATSLDDPDCWNGLPADTIGLLGSLNGLTYNFPSYFLLTAGVFLCYLPKTKMSKDTRKFLHSSTIVVIFGLVFAGRFLVIINKCYVIHQMVAGNLNNVGPSFGSCVKPFVYGTLAEQILAMILTAVSGVLLVIWVRPAE